MLIKNVKPLKRLNLQKMVVINVKFVALCCGHVTFRAEGELMQQLAKAYAAKFSEKLSEQAAGGKLIFTVGVE